MLIGVVEDLLNLLKTSPECTLAGVYGKYML